MVLTLYWKFLNGIRCLRRTFMKSKAMTVKRYFSHSFFLCTCFFLCQTAGLIGAQNSKCNHERIYLSPELVRLTKKGFVAIVKGQNTPVKRLYKDKQGIFMPSCKCKLIAKWCCEICTSINAESRKTCKRCGQAKNSTSDS